MGDDNTIGIIGLILLAMFSMGTLIYLFTRTTVVTVERTDKGYVIIEKRA
jgi:hypothetical protein